MWFLFTIITTLLWGAAELFYKKGAREDETYAHLKICVCVGAVMGIHAVYTLLTQDMGYRPVHLLQYLPVSLCYILSMALSFFGMRYIQESISDPIENTSGAICSIMCVAFLHEQMDPSAAAGILIIVVGILGVGFLEKNAGRERRHKIGTRLALIAFAMPFCYAVIDAFGSFLDIFFLDISTSPLEGVSEDTIELVANTSYELTFAVCGIILYVYMKLKGVKFALATQRDKVLAAVCETAGQLTYVYAMSGNGAIAAPIISSGCIVSVLLSRIFLKEKLTGLQYIFIGIVIAGIVILGITEGE